MINSLHHFIKIINHHYANHNIENDITIDLYFDISDAFLKIDLLYYQLLNSFSHLCYYVAVIRGFIILLTAIIIII